MIILYLLIFVLLCYTLVRSGSELVKLLAQLSHYFRLTEFVLAFILMTFATTLPELIVGIMSGIKGNSIVSLGNVIGSNFINLTFILGLVAIVSKGLRVESRIAKKDTWIIFFIALVPLVMLFDKEISSGEGFLLLIIFGWYIWYILKQKDAFKHRVNHVLKITTTQYKLLRTIFYFILSVAILVLSAWGVVESAKLIAQELYIPLALISIILVAIGTSLPELVFGIKAAITKHEGMSLGNLIGSVVINSTFILGITAIISPIRLENLNVILIGAGFMLLGIILANVFLSSGRKISIKEGWILVGLYILFLIAEFIFR
ncbi:MAG TPA: sodium:calcium antiporter [Candidatus Paceibacterota bacterium]|nr:sodium:calcium antiporter [Candidatus Paceibacterota bacterium]